MHLRVFYVFALVVSVGCGSSTESGSISDTAASSICDDVLGPTAAFWDISNGVAFPLGFVPTPGDGWARYQHPTYVPLGFEHPPNWTPTTATDPQTIGVDLVRNDTGAAWRYSTVLGSPTADPIMHLGAELDGLRELFDVAGTETRICANSDQSVPAPGILLRGESRLVDIENVRILVSVQTAALESLPGATVAFLIAAARIQDYETEIVGTFLPLHFQLLIGRESIQDSDGDGEPDTTDNFPFDPERQ